MERMAVFDTNILIDLLNNRAEAAEVIEQGAAHRAISLVTWMEVMVGAKKKGQENKTAALLSAF